MLISSLEIPRKTSTKLGFGMNVRIIKDKLRHIYRTQKAALRRLRRTEEDEEIFRQLNLMVTDNKEGHLCTQPGEGGDGSENIGWDSLTNRMIQIMELEGIGDLESQQYNEWFAGPRIDSVVYYRMQCYSLFLKIKAADKWGILDRVRTQAFEIYSQSRMVEFEGIWFTYDYLLSLLQILKVAEENTDIINSRCVVTDIGGGWGRIGNALRSINPQISYVHMDIPISSILAQSYLPKTSPDTPIYRYENYRKKDIITRKEIIDNPGFHFLGSHQIETLEKNFADTVFNIASFGEMTNKTVDFYFDQIDRICNGYLYMSQINFSNNKNGFLVSGVDYYQFLPNWKKIYVRDSDIKYQYFESLHHIST